MTPPPTASPLPSRPGFSWSRLGRLAGKELRESLRDRRTLLTLVLMPILLYPLLGLVFFHFFRSPLLALRETTYRLGLRNKKEAALLVGFLRKGERAMVRDQGFVPPHDKDAPEAPLPSPSTLRFPTLEYLTNEGEQATDADIEDMVRTGKVDVGLRLLREEGLTRMADDGHVLIDWKAIYLEDNSLSLEAVHYLQRLIAAANGEFLGERLALEHVKQRMPPVRLEPALLTNAGGRHYSLVAVLLPLILVLMTMTGAVYPAIDLTAGERERGTLEILMAAPIPRLSVLLAKYAAVLAVALLTAVINLGAMAGTLLVLGGGPFLFASGLAVVLLALEVLGLVVLFAAFFAAVLLTLTSATRSFKEAQAYLIPLMLLALIPGLVSLLPGMELQGINVWVPLLNIVLLRATCWKAAPSRSRRPWSCCSRSSTPSWPWAWRPRYSATRPCWRIDASSRPTFV